MRLSVPDHSGHQPASSRCLIDELVPVRGLVDIWGKPKCFKSFVTLDMMLHVSNGLGIS